jgi:hypothetical protein
MNTSTGEIERAGWAGMNTSMDDVIRQRCRNAPPFVRRHIDARREARGLRPLWPDATRAARAHARASAAVARQKAFLASARSR